MDREKAGGKLETDLQAVLAKLEPTDRRVVIDALDAAEKTETELRYLADHDSLTALLNRRAFRLRLDTYAKFAARYGGRGAVMVIDVDGLKEVNDRYGHQQGDTVLRRISTSLRERVRETDIVARLSGDEFAVLTPQSDVEGALQLGEDLRSQVADGFAADPDLAGVTISIGITMFGTGSAGGAESVLAAADEAMYRAKAGGRDRVALFEASLEAMSSDRRRLTTSAKIRDAITGDRLSLAAQPIARLADGAIERFELLLRMRSETGEVLPAAAFIDVAERTGMAQELDRWVIGQAFELLGRRDRADEPISLHVNLSAASLTDVSMLGYIERGLGEWNVDPSHCTFEITQTVRLEDLEAAAAFADRLTDLGCEVAIDDYGVGFGPFEYLKRFPFDVIKIDGAFVRDLANSEADRFTVQAIVGIARGLGKRTIAEFVEDQPTVDLLREFGVDMAQGFHLGPPTRVEDGLLQRI